MAFQEYALAVGNNNAAGLSNVEDLIFDQASRPRRFTLQATPVPYGSTEIVTLDQRGHNDGIRLVEWRYQVLLLAGLSVLVTRYIGDFATDYGSVTIRSRKYDGNFANFNAEMLLPKGYRIQKGIDGLQYARDLVIEFRLTGDL